MVISSSHGWARPAAVAILVALAVAAAASFLPLIETNTWWIRYLDFPRLQLAAALVVLLAAAAALRAHLGRIGWIVCAVGALALGYQAAKLLPYTEVGTRAAVELESCAPGDAITVMVANVRKRNETAEPFLRTVSDADPDLLLVLETDAWWDEALAPLDDRYPERTQFIPENHGAFGMHLLSKLPLVSPEFRFLFGAYTPTAVTGVELPDGEVAQVIGVHPHPPLAWSQPSTLRDASILEAGLFARDSDMATIGAGDLTRCRGNPWCAARRGSAVCSIPGSAAASTPPSAPRAR